MLQIDWTTSLPAERAGELLALIVDEATALDRLRARFGDSAAEAANRARFKGKSGQRFAFTRTVDGGLQNVAVFGGGTTSVASAAIRSLGASVTAFGRELGCDSVVLDLREGPLSPGADDAHDVACQLSESLTLGLYAYEPFLGEAKRIPTAVERVTVVGSVEADTDALKAGSAIARAVGLARDLGNAPAGHATPSHLADVARQLVDDAEGVDVSVDVLEREDCEKLGMGCYLGVAQGSDAPPKFIHLRYRPSGASKARVCLIGKGVTFDSGGYSLKPTDGMIDMKLDMAGSAAVIGAFKGLVELQVPYEVHVIVAATENMVSGRAYRLGDVLTASNGKTVEINNTDAEGRLTMADAMVYAARLDPDYIIDFATLTGACVVALGPYTAGVMSDDDALVDGWMRAAESSGESMWRLPLPPELKEQLESKIADMRNTGLRWGGALTAGLFLSEFTEGKRWMHVDIAGPGIGSKGLGHKGDGATGFPVSTILHMLRSEPL